MYPADYEECTEVAKKEQSENARPELKEFPDLAGYDTIFVGIPDMACIPQFDTMHPSMSLGANFYDRIFADKLFTLSELWIK
ncbi:MAG: hypothetical protein K2O16_09175 [Lachnospiraceae bacterium]|nr:hypothetical protein [Lachnospiraceae bacterium]